MPETAAATLATAARVEVDLAQRSSCGSKRLVVGQFGPSGVSFRDELIRPRHEDQGQLSLQDHPRKCPGGVTREKPRKPLRFPGFFLCGVGAPCPTFAVILQ
jgi:hypothetical protein